MAKKVETFKLFLSISITYLFGISFYFIYFISFRQVKNGSAQISSIGGTTMDLEKKLLLYTGCLGKKYRPYVD